jgi:DNA-binding response OmpR family regulator
MSNHSSSSAVRAFVFGNHPHLCKAIKVGLKQHFDIEFVDALPSEAEQRAGDLADRLDLVILSAISTSSPAALIDTLPGELLERVPVLVIVQEGKELGLDSGQISYLVFPFSYDELYNKIAEILSHASQAAYRKEPTW